MVLGIRNAGSGYRAYGPVVRDNYFTTANRTPYNIEIENADSAMIEGNSELVASIGPRNCFVNMVGCNPHLDFKERDLPEKCLLLQRGSGNALHERRLIFLRPTLAEMAARQEIRYPLSKNISRKGPQNCRSLRYASLRSDDKGRGEASMGSGCWAEDVEPQIPAVRFPPQQRTIFSETRPRVAFLESTTSCASSTMRA